MDKERVRKAIQAGTPVKSIAETEGVTPATVRKFIHDNKIDASKLRGHGRPRAVICLDDGEQFTSSAAAAKKYGVSLCGIHRACKNVRFTSADRHWMYLDDFNALTYKGSEDVLDIVATSNSYRRKRAVINLDTGKVYPSASQAARENYVSVPSIITVCSGRGKHAAGYRWAYYDEYTKDEGKN